MSAAENTVPIRRDERGRALELPPALQATKWQKGQIPNPTGKGGEYIRCMQLCRAKSYEAADEVIRLGRESPDDRVRYMANTWVYERAWGKPRDFDPKAEQPGVPVFDPSAVSPQQLEMIKQAMLLMQQAMTVVDVVEGE